MSLSHLKKLSAVKSNAGIKFLTPAAAPGSHCPMHTALALSKQIRGLSTLVVGTAECSNYGRMASPKIYGADGEMHWLYVLDKTEVVFGCRDGLAAAIQEMDKAGARVILLIITCVPEVIGEDVEGLVHELQPTVSARLAFVLLAHFKCQSFPSGFWKTLLALGEFAVPAAKTQAINVLCPMVMRHELAFPIAMLRENGFEIRIFSTAAAITNFKKLGDAVLNLVLSPYADPLAAMLEEKFQIPTVYWHRIYSIEEIDNAVTLLETTLSIPLAEHFQAEREALLTTLQAAKPLADKSFVQASLGHIAPLPLVDFLANVGMKPLLVHLEEFFPVNKSTKWSANPPICHMANPETDLPIISTLNADCILGMFPRGQAVPAVEGLPQALALGGYARSARILQLLIAHFEEGKNGAL